jgi:hypothetical protein
MAQDQKLEQFFGEETADDGQEALSRRRFLTGAVAGGAAGLAVAAGAGAAVWNIADTKAQVAMEDAEAEIARLQGLVDLYENLEKIPLEAILKAGMAAVALPIDAVQAGARALKNGLEAIEDALISLEEALPSAREAILWLERRVKEVSYAIADLERSIGQALERASDNPIAERLQAVVGMVLDKLPFDFGDRIRGVFAGLVDLLTSIDELVEGINTRLLQPLRLTWFSADEGEGIGALLVDPLVENILDPLEAHLEELVTLADTWESKLVAPTQEALQERAALQDEILRYKKDHGFV